MGVAGPCWERGRSALGCWGWFGGLGVAEVVGRVVREPPFAGDQVREGGWRLRDPTRVATCAGY